MDSVRFRNNYLCVCLSQTRYFKKYMQTFLRWVSLSSSYTSKQWESLQLCLSRNHLTYLRPFQRTMHIRRVLLWHLSLGQSLQYSADLICSALCWNRHLKGWHLPKSVFTWKFFILFFYNFFNPKIWNLVFKNQEKVNLLDQHRMRLLCYSVQFVVFFFF